MKTQLLKKIEEADIDNAKFTHNSTQIRLLSLVYLINSCKHLSVIVCLGFCQILMLC